MKVKMKVKMKVEVEVKVKAKAKVKVKVGVWLAAGFVGLSAVSAEGVRPAVNYDESKIPAYTLEDPLKFLDGRDVTQANWPERRREILGIFAREMYGAEPPAPAALVTDLVDEKVGAVAGFAIRRQYRMWFAADRTGPCVNWIVWLPRFVRGKVPVISLLNYRGNHELVSDPDVPVTTAWIRNARTTNDTSVVNHRAQESGRGRLQSTDGDTAFPIRELIARGYAVMSACYAEVSPDPDASEPDPRYRQTPFAYTGVFSLWGPRDESRTDNITAIGAWAWALSRGLDLAARIPEIDITRSVVTGCSRLAKAALLAAARDERFAVCVPCQTGGGGAPLAKRDFGENTATETQMFTHWYCKAYSKYAERPWETLGFDQHLLLACVAPRALLVEGFDSPWFDTEGEFLAVKAASPVWETLVGSGLPMSAWPRDLDESAIGWRLGYVRRSQGHGISAYDWKWLLDFAEGAFLETPYWQRKIDCVAAAGGGRVTVTPGLHRVGELRLKSHVELHLAEGAVLEGAHGLRNYRVTELPHSEGTWSGVVTAYGAEDVSVTGTGVIDGRGDRWSLGLSCPKGVCKEGLRPRGLVFGNCRNVRLADFTLRDAACWGIVFKCCDGVEARRIRIDSHAHANNDGFDIEAKNVVIADCDVDAGDDAICIKSNDPAFSVENLLVTNCVARSHCNGLKIGTASHGTVRNVRFVDCRTESPRRDFLRRGSRETGETYYQWRALPGFPNGLGSGALCVENVDGGIVEDISFENVEAVGFYSSIFVRGGHRTKRTCAIPCSDKFVLRNISFRHVRGRNEAVGPATITGVDICRPTNVTLEDVVIECVGEGEPKGPVVVPGAKLDGAYPDAGMFRDMRLPAYGLYVDRARDVRMDRVAFPLRAGTSDTRQAVVGAE